MTSWSCRPELLSVVKAGILDAKGKAQQHETYIPPHLINVALAVLAEVGG